MKVKFPVDEFLGELIPTTEHSFILDGEEVTVDVGDDTLAILKAIVAQDGSAPDLLRAMFMPAQEPAEEEPEPNGDKAPAAAFVAPQAQPDPPKPFTMADEETRRAVRTWAKGQGHTLKQGPVPAQIVDEYKTAHGIK